MNPAAAMNLRHSTQAGPVSSPSSEVCIAVTDAWMDEVEAVAAQGNPEDDARLEAALVSIREREKELTRKKWALSNP